jgi:hypothetical protein
MANIFAITTATGDIKADADGKASAFFTVTNTSSKPMRGIAKARTLGNTQQDWLSVEGETERDFSANGTQQFTVNFRKPVVQAAAGTPATPEKFPFRLDVSSALNPDEQFTEGPAINVEVTPSVKPPPPTPFKWWYILIIVGALALIAGIVIFFAFCGKGSGKFTGNWVNATPAQTPPPSFPFVVTKLDIDQSGKVLQMHAFSKCTPADCDFGTATGTVGDDGKGKIMLDHGYLYHNIELTKDDANDKLSITMSMIVRYGGSTPQTATFIFNRQPPPQ